MAVRQGKVWSRDVRVPASMRRVMRTLLAGSLASQAPSLPFSPSTTPEVNEDDEGMMQVWDGCRGHCEH